MSKRKFLQPLFLIGTIPLIILISVGSGAKYAEPWVSCKLISDDLKKHSDFGASVVLASKFYVRGIRFYTDRKLAVMDINGKGFFSPHPVPFLNTDQKVLDFLETQSVTYCVLKESNVKDLERIAKDRFTVKYLSGEGGKHILRVEKKI